MIAPLLGVLLLTAQDPALAGTAIERTVRVTTIDWLGKKEELQRKDLVLVKGSNLVIIDLTFGDRLIIRSDLKKIWKIDPLAREYSELTFERAAALRKEALDDVRSAKTRVPGTGDEKELEGILEGFDQFSVAPRVELKASGSQREVILNGDRVRVSVEINEQLKAPGWMDALSGIGAFHPLVAERLKDLGGTPVKGTLRYVLFLKRVIEQFEATSVRQRDIPDAEFELPAGLARIPLRGFEPPPQRTLSKPPLVNRSFKEDEGDRPKSDSGEKKGK